MKSIEPSEEELKRKINEQRAKRGEKEWQVDTDIYKKQIQMIIENSKGDKPVWDVQWGTKK
ncbi:hypothetical protein HDV04_006043 [Boothiomyces sp. JEL0838]|nr:hypothetical protein HDV04_006043 [Boothiomyces sp. JEL0838]